MAENDDLATVLAQIGPGARVVGEPADDSEHFYVCAACGQAVDMRDLSDVFHHDKPDHEPRPRS